MCINFLLDDLVIRSGTMRDANNVAQDPDQQRSLDCFTQAMIDERVSWSMQRCHKIWELRGEPATVADYDKFLDSFEDSYPGACDGRSVWLIDCEKIDGSDQDKNLEIHVGRNSTIMKSIFGIQGLPRAAWTSVCGNITILLSQERPDHGLQEAGVTVQLQTLSRGRIR